MVALGLALSTDEASPKGNIARVSRDTGVPEATIRDWRDEWENNGIPPEVKALMQHDASGFAEQAERVRDRALQELRKRIPEMTGKDLAVAIGILTDKSMRSRGLATSKVEHVRELPSPEEIRELGAALVDSMRGAMNARRDEIVYLDEGEQSFKELPPPGRS